MHVIVWAFEVKSGRGRDFEKMYGPNGGWIRLFEKHPGYEGTELLRDVNHAGRYLTVDRWDSREAYDAFKEQSRTKYEELNAAGEALTKTEKLVGRFDTPP